MDRSNKLQKCVIGALFAGITLECHAARVPWAIRRAESGLFLGIGKNILHTQEGASGSPIASEDGDLSAYTLGLAHLASRAGGLYWRLRLTGAFGTTRYHGNTALGLPAQGSNTGRVVSIDGRLGLGIDGLWRGDRALILLPYLGMGFQRSTLGGDRNSAYAGDETLTGGHLGLGLGADYALDRRWVLSLHALTGYTLGTQATATVPTFFDASTGTLQSTRVAETLGDRPYEAIGGAISYRADRRLDISLHVRRAIWSATGSGPLPILDSSGVTLGTTRIPSSRSTDTSIMIEVRTLF